MLDVILIWVLFGILVYIILTTNEEDLDSKVKVFRCHPDAQIPMRAEDGAAGYDLRALEGFSIAPGEKVVVRTGLVIQPPKGYHTEILARSGSAYKHNVTLMNSVGLIDYSYSGPSDEIKVMLYRAPLSNGRVPTAEDSIVFEKYDRIAQIVFRKTELFDLVEVPEAPASCSRDGLGHTGTK